MSQLAQTIAQEISASSAQVNAAIDLLDEGATVPFIARYRKEKTGGLDDIQLRTLEERLIYLRDMESRRLTILSSIEEQGKLTPDLKKRISDADTKTRLEDLYLPYKPKRRTKGQIAIEAGLLGLADELHNNPATIPEALAASYLNPEAEIQTNKDALDGAKFILMERFAENADLIASLRHILAEDGYMHSDVMTGKEKEGEKFRDYFEYREQFSKVPPHRAMALFRGRKEAILALKLDLEVESLLPHPAEGIICKAWQIQLDDSERGRWMAEVIRWTWRIKLHMQIESDLLASLRSTAEAEAIKVFASNLKDLLLAAPAGQKATMGLDPGLRTGVKVAVVSATGQFLEHATIYPHAPQDKWDQSMATLAALAKKHDVNLLAVGNGTASRETEKLCKDLLKQYKDLKCQPVMVNEAGASVYSASVLAAQEFPDLDVTIRGAISIARRLQDPLAELVKIEPKAIGVGQYQHDVSQVQLGKSLENVIEDCVNGVGVELNTASAPLLSQVSGISTLLAENIVSFRDQQGSITSRQQLMQVPRMGEKSFEQAAGFLRIHGGDNPLDVSGVHPEAYPVVEAIAKNNSCTIAKLVGNSSLLKSLKARDYVTDTFGLPTVQDIIQELDKPGRDPRPEFKTASFQEGVEKISDLRERMILEGTVTNVTHFGAFVDIGVHQDGLVHISALSEKFVKDPREVVKTGDIVKVKVMEVEIQRQRIALSMRLHDEPSDDKNSKPERNNRERSGDRNRQYKAKTNDTKQPKNAFAAAFEAAKK